MPKRKPPKAPPKKPAKEVLLEFFSWINTTNAPLLLKAFEEHLEKHNLRVEEKL